MENKALGRGLSALIPGKIAAESSGGDPSIPVTTVPISKIKDNRVQPRGQYSAETLEELKDSIRSSGILQPILVRPIDNGYEVVAGERRLRAARALNLTEVPVVVRQTSDNESLVLALVENIQRENLNALEEALAYKRLVDDFGMTVDEIAKSVGKSPVTVGNVLRLLKLPEIIRNALSENLLSMGHARALINVDNPAEQQRIFKAVLTKNLSVREVEHQAKAVRPPSAPGPSKRGVERHHELIHLEEELQRNLGTKVRIQAKRKRGKIIIEYYSNDDLERVLALLRGASVT